jgi:two-component system cell cycle sensor histidine kinase/response regulator CckA
VLDQRVRSQRLVFTLRDITERKRAADALTLLTTGVAYLRGEAFYRYLSEQVSKLLGEPIGFISKVVGADHDRVRIIALCVDGHATPGVEFNLAGTPCADALERGVIVIPEGAQQAFPSAGVFAELKVSGYAAVALRDSTGGVMGNVGVMSRAPLREPGQVESILRLFAVRIAREMEREAADWKFRDLFEYSPDGNVIVNQAGIITMVNRQAESMFGYSRQELVGQTLEILLPQADRPGHDRLRHGYVRDPQTRSMGASRRDLHALRKDGTVFPVDISLNPLHSDEGMQVVAAVRDVSARVQDQEQRKALEAQLVQAQKMEAVGTLAGGIAHDFNNILSAIIGNVVLAREDVGANSPVLQSLDEILVASRRARDLVGQILAFSRQQRNEVSPVALPSVVGEVIALLRGTLPAGVEITSRHSAGLPDILADATHVHQILMNLCTNAIQAVGREGRIDIEIEDVLLDERTRPVGTDLKPGRYVRLAVRDNGTGMDEQTCRRVFEPFFTTKDVGKGTGLGLSVVHGIVRSYGGAIMVRSSPGAGSTFVLHFPASNVWAGATPDQSVPVTERRGGGQRILYVDDDEMLLFLVKRALERQGYQVSTYSNQEDALQALRANPSQFSLVLTDYTMPGMSGLDVAREVSRIRSDLPVAVTTGYITDSLRAEAPAAGVRELIYKPNSAEALCETVQRLLENGS